MSKPLVSVALTATLREWLQPVSIALPENLSFAKWEEVGEFLQMSEGAVQWWIGDWLNYGEFSYGEKYAQAISAAEVTGRAVDTMRSYQYVSERVKLCARRTSLPWGHHRDVASLEPDVQDRLLALAENNAWTRSELREAIRALKALTNGNGKSHAPPQEPAPAPQSSGDPGTDPGDDLLADLERTELERGRLADLVETLTTDDTATALAKLSERYARLEGRLKQEMTTRSEAEKEAKYAKGVLAKVRKALGVEGDRGILTAIQELKR